VLDEEVPAEEPLEESEDELDSEGVVDADEVAEPPRLSVL
jgi:hypothetical protein